MIVKRGDIFYADLSPVIGSEQGGLRPVLIVQNDVGNRYSPTVIAAAITSKTGKTKLPTHIDVTSDIEGGRELGLARDSVILLEQVRTIDKRRLRERIGHLDIYTMQKVNLAISVSFGLEEEPAAVASGVSTAPAAAAVVGEASAVGGVAPVVTEATSATPVSSATPVAFGVKQAPVNSGASQFSETVQASASASVVESTVTDSSVSL